MILYTIPIVSFSRNSSSVGFTLTKSAHSKSPTARSIFPLIRFQYIPGISSLPSARSRQTAPASRLFPETEFLSEHLLPIRIACYFSKSPSIFSFHADLSMAPTTVSKISPFSSTKNVVGTALTPPSIALKTDSFNSKCT